MAINIKFDLAGNPELPTIILANRNGNKLGQLKVNTESVDLSDKFNDASEISFTVNKYIDDKLTPLWDKLVDFKLIYCKEWDMWFEAKVELDEETETVKTVLCTQLGQAELSQIMLYNIEINTEKDIERDDYKTSILYDEQDANASILNRLLKDKAPHYSIIYVSPTIAKIQRSFSFDDTSIYDAFQEIAEEIGCLFIFHSNSDENGKIQRTISVYDLQQYCNDCGHRGEFSDKCPKCDSANITSGYGDDTSIFVTSDELASSGIQLATDTDSVKNCFKLEAGDDLMTATVRNCNPNGTDYIWYFSEALKEDMSNELVVKLDLYNDLYKYYYNDHMIFDKCVAHKELLSSNESKTLVAGVDFYTGNIIRFMCLAGNARHAEISYTKTSGLGFGSIRFNTLLGANESKYLIHDLNISEDIKTVTVNEYVDVYVVSEISEYNDIVSKYKTYNNDLQEIVTPIKGYSSLMNAYYNTIDLELYLKSGLMPSVEMSKTSAEEQAKLLTTSSLSPVAVSNMSIASLSTVNSTVLAMAKIAVKSTYKVQINTSELYDDNGSKYWTGNFVITNYSDEEDTAVSDTISVEINDDLETFTKQKIEKALNKEDTDDFSISGLFKKEYDEFCAELKKYALNPLTSFHDACQACIDILIEQGVGSDTAQSNDDNSESNLYENLYIPYYNKLMAIESETKIREDEINIISGVYDVDGNLIVDGLRTDIEKYKTEIQDALDFEKYLGIELWIEFCAYRREDKYSNDNYISDGLDNAELFIKAQEFFEVAENEIYKSSELQHSISTTLNNLLAIPKFKDLVKSFKVGNWIRVKVDNGIFKLRLLEYKIEFGSFNDIPVEFSDVTKIKNGITDVKNILSQASSMATSYSSVQRQASQGEKSNSVIDNWIKSGLNATNTKIVGTDNQNQVWDKNGILCRQYDPITETYSGEQLKIINSTIAITDNNWETTKTAIGKHYYIDPYTKELKSIYGVNGETIVGKLLIGEQLDISNSNGDLEFGQNGLVVKNGINAVSINPSSESIFNISNNDGNILSLNEKGELVIVGNITASSLTLLDGTKIDGENVTGLSDVALSGSYNDLKDKPALSTVATSGSYNDLKNKPTKLSDFTNDNGFITKDINNLTNYYNKTQIDNLLELKVNVNDLAKVSTSGSYNDLTDIDEFKNWVLEQIQSAINQ